MCAQHSPVKLTLSKSSLLPQEETLEIGKKQKKLIIGIPKEDETFENRVSLTPEAVEILVNNGHDVIIESNAGKASNYNDIDYSDRGGFIVRDRRSVFQADVILKVSPLRMDEIGMLRGQQTIITSLFMMNQSEEYFRELMTRKVNALSFETIMDENNCYPIVRSMSSIAGTASVLIAAEYLSSAHGGKGVLLGGITGITPTEVVIIGAGTAAEFAVRAAFGLGAYVKVFDNSVNSLVQLQNTLGMRLNTSVFHPQVLEKALRSADVLISAKQSFDIGPRFFVTESMVKSMKKGSVIIDIGTATFGCIETSEPRTQSNPVYSKYGVIHYCIPNLPSRVARTSSIALSNVFLPMLLKVAEVGGFIQQLKQDTGLRKGVYIFNGILTNQHIGGYFDIPSSDIDLLMAAF